MYRFYLPTLASAPTTLQLPEDQAHHAIHVLRLSPGEPVILFDGQGAWAPATIAGDPTAKLKNKVLLTLSSPIKVDPPPSPALTIAVAVPKADRADWLIEQASQLNVTQIQWLATDRTIVKPKEAKLEKHRRLAIESAKQCHRTHLLQISAPLPLNNVLGVPPSGGPPANTQILWLDPAPENSTPIHSLRSAPAHSILALIGPEGGWSPREHSLLESLAQQKTLTRTRLTPTILRIETAATALAAIIMSQ